MEVGSSNGKVVAVRPADHPTNRGYLCAKGRYAFEPSCSEGMAAKSSFASSASPRLLSFFSSRDATCRPQSESAVARVFVSQDPQQTVSQSPVKANTLLCSYQTVKCRPSRPK
jgi:hypothetical protein